MSDFNKFDYIERLKSRITSYPSRNEQIPNYIAALACEAPDMEDTLKDIYDSFSLINASGDQVDRFGEYVDVPQDGMDDVAYKDAIRKALWRKSYSGTIPEVIQVARQFTGSSVVGYLEMKPAAYNLHLDGLNITPDFKNILNINSVCGVGAYFSFYYGVGESFYFGGLGNSSGAKLLGIQQGGVYGVRDNTALGTNKNAYTSGGSDFSGLKVTPQLLGETGTTNAIGVNGVALGINKYKPIYEEIDNDIYFSGTY